MPLAERERKLQRIVNEYDSVCRRRMLKVNISKSKVLIVLREQENRLLILQSYIEWGHR